MGEASPTPNQRMAIGIQAIGEMGRRIWKMGFSVRYAPRTQPIHNPSGTATQTASPKPAPTRMSEAPMCRHSVPSFNSSSVPVTTAHGVGKITLWVVTTATHQMAISAAIDSERGKRFLDSVHGGSSVWDCQVERMSSRVRQTIRAHGVVGLDSTTIVIWPLACAVQANWYSAARSKGSRKLWPGIIRVGPKICGTSSWFRSTRMSRRPEGQADMVGQDLHLVAGHAPRPGSLAGFEDLIVRGGLQWA